MKKYIAVLIFVFCLFSISCSSSEDGESKGACAYSSDHSSCADSTTYAECHDDLEGAWFEGKSCNEIHVIAKGACIYDDMNCADYVGIDECVNEYQGTWHPDKTCADIVP